MSLRLAVLIAAAALARGAEPAEARWEGTIEIPGRELTVVIDLAQEAGGKWIGSAIVPGFSVKGAPLADIQVNGSEVHFAIKGALAEPVFRGRLNSDGSLNGDFQQAGNTAAFSLQKAGPAQVDPPSGGTAVAKEFEGEWQGEFSRNGYTLKATLQIANHPGAPATAEFRVVGKRDTKLPVDRVKQEGDWLTVSAAEYQIAYEGQMRAGAGEITGTLRQGPDEQPLTFRRAGRTP